MKISRRSLLLGGSPALLLARPSIRVACQTSALKVDPRSFESVMGALATIKQLGFQGFETSFVNMRSQFTNPLPAFERLGKAGLKFFGMSVTLRTYEEQTSLPPFELLQQVADGVRALDADRIIISGAPTVHPVAARAKADALTRIEQYCRRIGVGCAYLNKDFEFRDRGAHMEGLVHDTESSVHFVLNAPEALLAGANVADFFSRNSRRIDGIHIATEGAHDYGPLAKAIQASNWRGWLVTEEADREAVRRIFGV